jgi:hypothetical protein
MRNKEAGDANGGRRKPPIDNEAKAGSAWRKERGNRKEERRGESHERAEESATSTLPGALWTATQMYKYRNGGTDKAGGVTTPPEKATEQDYQCAQMHTQIHTSSAM